MKNGSITIIEGMRCSGKTHLIHQVVAMDHSIVPLKFKRIYDPFVEMQLIIRAMETLDKKFLIDRFHLTELIYRWNDGIVPVDKLFLGSCLIERLLQELHAKTFILSIDQDTYLSRMDKRDTEGLESAIEDISYEKAVRLWHDIPTLINAKPFYLQNNNADDLAHIVKVVFNATRTGTGSID